MTPTQLFNKSNMTDEELEELRDEFEEYYSNYREETDRKLIDSNTKIILIIVIIGFLLLLEFVVFPLS